MAVNQVIVGDEVKLDLTADTVSEDNLLAGATAHNAAGEPIEGAVVVAPIDSELSETSENAIQNMAVAKAINSIASGASSPVSQNVLDNSYVLNKIINTHKHRIVFETSCSWTVPEDVNNVSFVLVNGGASGSITVNSSTSLSTGIGADGRTACYTKIEVEPGDILRITVGSGGSAPSSTVSYTNTTHGYANVSGTSVSSRTGGSSMVNLNGTNYAISGNSECNGDIYSGEIYGRKTKNDFLIEGLIPSMSINPAGSGGYYELVSGPTSGYGERVIRAENGTSGIVVLYY